MTKLALSLAVIFAIASYSCRKQQITTDKTAILAFSTDSVKFDTVFTTVGSATHNFLVKNPNKKAVVISNIHLGGGTASYFKINVDGHAGTQLTNYTLAGGDSMFVFVQVTINPNNTSTPFIVTDSILFTTNGNLQMVKLVAFGQNAHFFASQAVCNTIWNDTLKPYVIYNSILVPPGCTLTILPGVKVYSHRGSAIIVQGTMNVIGTHFSPVIFQGDRLEQFYATAPGQWYGIWFDIYRGSGGNGTGSGSFTNAVIKNAVVGIEADSLLPGNVASLILNKTKIQNMATAGIYGRTSHIIGTNLLINNCGQYLVFGNLGGTYNFQYCTFDNSNSDITSSSASVIMATNAVVTNPLTTSFTDCIIWGSVDDMVEIDTGGNIYPMYFFKYNLIKNKSYTIFNASNRQNRDPQFKDPYNANYHFSSTSSVNFGNDTLSVTDDIDGTPRTAPYVVGCYAK